MGLTVPARLYIFWTANAKLDCKSPGSCRGWNGSYFRPFVPVQPSSLRQSTQTNGGPHCPSSGPNNTRPDYFSGPPNHFPTPFAQQFQFPKLSDSPTTVTGRGDSLMSDSLVRKNDVTVQMNGRLPHHDHHRTLPSRDRPLTQRKDMINSSKNYRAFQ